MTRALTACAEVRTLTAIHLLAKLAFVAHDAASALKLLDAGLAREDLSLLAALDFPVQLVGGALAARWCTPRAPLRPWAAAFGPRAALVGAMAVLVAVFRPVGWCYGLLGVLWFAQSFAGTLQYASMAAFHVRVADPAVGGSYMTLLATFANLGGTWPRWFVLRGVDAFSQARCEGEPAWAALGDGASVRRAWVGAGADAGQRRSACRRRGRRRARRRKGRASSQETGTMSSRGCASCSASRSSWAM
jgi:PAT family acetyl-CoA transporter-like MFS transporter 1